MKMSRTDLTIQLSRFMDDVKPPTHMIAEFSVRDNGLLVFLWGIFDR